MKTRGQTMTGTSYCAIVNWYADGRRISVDVARDIAAAWSETDDDAFAVFAATDEIRGDFVEAIRLAWVAGDDDLASLSLEALVAYVRAIQAPDEAFLAGDNSARDYLFSIAPTR